VWKMSWEPPSSQNERMCVSVSHIENNGVIAVVSPPLARAEWRETGDGFINERCRLSTGASGAIAERKNNVNTFLPSLQ
jgi:hypothetical protein